MVFGLSKGMYNITTGFMSMTPWDMVSQPADRSDLIKDMCRK